MSVKEIFEKCHLHIQETQFTCGASAILNVLQLKGDFTQHEEAIAKFCDSQPGRGATHAHMINAVQQFGLTVTVHKSGSTIQDIHRYIDEGNYVIVNYYHAFAGVGHYAVVTDYDETAIYLVDSSLGLLRLQNDDFMKYWHNTKKTSVGLLLVVR